MAKKAISLDNLATFKEQYDLLLGGALSGKQDTLQSGVNLKTINDQSLLGSGNIEIQGRGSIDVDDHIDHQSTNPVENRVIADALDGKVDGVIVEDVTHAEQYVTQELMNLLAFAPTMRVTWDDIGGSPTHKKIHVKHPLMNYEDAEIVLLNYRKRNGKIIQDGDWSYTKKYSIATPGHDASEYFTFSAETDFDDFVTFMESFVDDNYVQVRRTNCSYGIALRIPNPEYDGPESLNKNNIYRGVPESLWSSILPVLVTYDRIYNKWGIGCK